MLKKSWLWLLLVLPSLSASADEGMWLPMFIKRLNYVDMQKKGLKLTAEEIYSVNNSSLKDAVGQFGGGCTAEFVSSQGLLLTNHHCGYGQIQSHSTPQNDLLKNGFYAPTPAQELPNMGLTMDVLVRMDDMTSKVLEGVTPGMAEADRAKLIAEHQKTLGEAATEGGKYVAYVRDFFGGNEFYLFVYQRFGDVRLVGTPPESVGKFGGDTDNWMWPRHTGDFSVFRVYADKNNQPTAGYSADNKPYSPKKFLPVSMSGVREGDFAMIFGFPGRTQRFLPAAGLQMMLDQTHPSSIKLRDTRLKLWKESMNQSADLRIKYASKHARIANYWKYFIGQSEGMKRLKTIDTKKAEEARLATWIGQDATRQQQYGSALNTINTAYQNLRENNLSTVYYSEAGLGTEINAFAVRFEPLYALLKDPKADPAAVKKAADGLKAYAATYFKDYDVATDKKVFAALMQMYATDVPKAQQAEVFRTVDSQYSGSWARYADNVFGKSFLTSKAAVEDFLANPTAAKLEADPGFATAHSLYTNYQTNILSKNQAEQAKLAQANRAYVAGIRGMNGNKVYSPDANSTIRLSYGSVKAYDGRDAVHYDLMTTAQGILEKEDPSNPEFEVPQKALDLIKAKDFGSYADKRTGQLPVAFLTTNDITGGNSGSPVINGRGELLGLAFDGNWEAMTGDLVYDADLKRTICVDIRYVLWCIDKLGGAPHLVKEMQVVNNGPNPGVGATASANAELGGKVKLKTSQGKVKVKSKDGAASR
ncbi:S46 family peptidase [Hymenobacter saemangeumensis]|uniref:Dipeptidyl-peptidase n=1 Tax=Hymenobacter saemangeumensis TaxID=1084522 RepID=A0ABP8I9H8_9BACT